MDNGASSYRRYLNGDDQGITEIVDEYKDGLILYINGQVENYSVAEELAEETFYRLITRRPRFSERSSFKSWLYAIGHHVTVDYLRRRIRLHATPVEELAEVLADGTDLERAYLQEERKITLHRALRELAPDYRAVLWLTYFEGFSYAEAAVAMGRSERQIKNLQYRARQSLKSKLEKEGFVYEDQ